MNRTDIRFLQTFVSELSANASTLRGRPAGTVKRVRRFLRTLNLERYAVDDKAAFLRRLDHDTESLRKVLPQRQWGVARKSLNLFLRDVLYNHYLRRHFGLRRIESWLEIPLDSYSMKGMAADPVNRHRRSPLRPIPIKDLTREVNCRFQRAAREIAARIGTQPVHLDLRYFRAKRSNK